MPGRELSFENDRGHRLAGEVDGDGDRGVVLCSHFTGFKELSHLVRLGQALGPRGFRSLRFDYADCIGESEGACEDKTVTHQVRDTLAALEALREDGAESLSLWGHSLGGLTALAATCQDADIAAISVVAAPAHLDWETAFSSRAERWREQGYVTFDTWKQGTIRVDYGFYEDLQRYDARDIVERIDAPIQVVHATEDALIDRKNAEAIVEHAAGPTELVEIEGADHLFSQEDHEEQMIEACRRWFDRYG